MSDKRWDVLGCGFVAVDDLILVDHYPPADSKTRVLEHVRVGGGLTGTALVAAARFGARTCFAGILGWDELSRFVIEALSAEKIDVSPVIRWEGARPVHSIIIVDRSTKSRTIFYEDHSVIPRSIQAMSPDLIGGARVLFVDMLGPESALRAVELAHANGSEVVADLEWIDDQLARLLEQIDHLILPWHLAAQIAGTEDPASMMARLARYGRMCTAVTRGVHGTWYAVRGGPMRHQPAFRVETVDTTGCGDVFHGVYAACIAEGVGPERAIVMASAAAAIKAAHPAGWSGIPDRREILMFLRERGYE